jgi:hypothetical protein
MYDQRYRMMPPQRPYERERRIWEYDQMYQRGEMWHYPPE